MSAGESKFPKSPVPARKVHQRTQIVGKNGLPVDALATLEPGSSIIRDNTNGITYTSPTVTVDASIDLNTVINYTNPQHTGTIIFTDSTNKGYFIDRDSINNTTKTFDIYLDPDFTTSPSSISLDPNWLISEAELVNRLQTTTSAVIDSVEFNEVDIKLDLDGTKGDSVKIVDSENDELEIEDDGSINANVEVDAADGDSIMIVGTEDGTPTGTQHTMRTDGFGRQFVKRYGPDILFELLTNARFLDLANYDNIVPTYVGDDVTLDYYEDGNLIRQAIFTFTSEVDWEVELKSFVLEEGGAKILLEDDTDLFLE